ncbi:MAG TPA: SDR family oxidoreductase [Chloroflexota bacterium]|jgi:uncharacterized protein YbjT (DUF2867 family)|nr:SDR family oxidoreductase [Chloroflexota bacterium]
MTAVTPRTAETTRAATGIVATTDPTGQLGRRVVARLQSRGIPQRLLPSEPAVAAATPELTARIVGGNANRDAQTLALVGARTLFLVPLREQPERVRLHQAIIDAAVAAGVARIVYSSFLGAASDATFTLARDHAATEQYIRSTGLTFTFLRGSAFFEVLRWIVGSDGVIRGPAADGRFAPIARDDLADVIAAVLASGGVHDGQTYDVTGPTRLSLHDIADEFSRVTGQRIRYVDQTVEEAWVSRRSLGAPAWLVEAWITTYQQIGRGELDVVTDTVPQLAGHPAQTLRDHLSSTPDSHPQRSTLGSGA